MQLRNLAQERPKLVYYPETEKMAKLSKLRGFKDSQHSALAGHENLHHAGYGHNQALGCTITPLSKQNGKHKEAI